jgi:hypothetical protein
LQADPLGLGASDLTNPQSLNLYGYVQNDPVNFVDPEGLNLEAPGSRSPERTGGIGIFSPGIHLYTIDINESIYGIFIVAGGFGSGFGGGDERGGGGGEQNKSEAAPVTCTIGLGARPIDQAVIGGTFAFQHMFVTTKQSNQSYTLVWHAFPGQGERAGLLSGRANVFEKTDEDYDKFHAPRNGQPTFSSSKELLGTCDSARASFDASMAAINSKKYKYPTGGQHFSNSTYNLTNSNAFAYTLLGQFSVNYRGLLLKGLNMDVNRTPGWGTNLLPK